MTYDEWLNLTPAEREQAHRRWNTNTGENHHIPERALHRLIEASELAIVDGFVGQYHGGEYILCPRVRAERLDSLPQFLESSFEGFRVGYVAAEDSE